MTYPGPRIQEVDFPRVKGLGHCAKCGQRLLQESNSTASNVLVHILYYVLDNTGKTYSVVPRMNKGECRRRMLQLDNLDVGWRDLSDVEFMRYNLILQNLLNIMHLELIQHGIYGILLNDKFLISDADPLVTMNDLKEGGRLLVGKWRN